MERKKCIGQLKRIFTLFAALFLCVTLCVSFAGCGGETKYDVSIKVVNTLGDEFIFTPDVDELSATYEYTGEDVWYYVDSYQMPDHPEYGDIWLEPMQQGYDYISMHGVYEAPDGSTTDITAPTFRCTNARGEYGFNIYIADSSVSWYGRVMNLYITIV